MSLPSIYYKGPYHILSASGEFIVRNARKPFEEGHTHIRTLKTAKYVIDCAIKKRIPRTFTPYLLTSLQRISTDDKYIEQIEELKQVRKQKGRKLKFYNKGGGENTKRTQAKFQKKQTNKKTKR